MFAPQLLLAVLLAAGSPASDKKKADKPAPQLPAPQLPPDLMTLPLPQASPKAQPPPKAATSGFQLGIYRLVPPGTADDAPMSSIEDTFMDVAQASKRYRNVVKLAKPPKLCDLEDDNCFALLGGFQQLDQILVGEVLKLQNGAAVKIRLIDVQKGKAIGQKALTLQTDDNNEVKAWAEALACDLLNNTSCKGQAMIDVDLADMRVIVDNIQYPRTGQNPETFTLPLGVHSVRVMVDQRTSIERKLLVPRQPPAKPALFARQLAEGGITLMRSQDLQLGAAGKSQLGTSVKTVELKQTKWTKPVGYTVAAVGLLGLGAGVVEGLQSKKLVSDANTRYKANGGAYLQSDLATLDSARGAASTANILYIAGAVLLATGLTLSFAF